MSAIELNEKSGLASIAEAYDALLKARPGFLSSESGGELSWLHKARERSAGRWLAQGIPTRNQERWRYTSFAALEGARVVLPNGRAHVSTPAEAGFVAEVALVDGVYSPSLSRLGSVKGVEITLLSEIFEECVNEGWSEERLARFRVFREHVETSDVEKESSFAAMNTSFLRDAVLVSVAPNAVIESPIRIRHWSAAASGDGLALTCPRVFLHVGRGASIAIIEEFGGEGSYFTNAVCDVRLEESARLTHVSVQGEDATGLHVSTIRVHQKRDSWSESFQFDFGAKLARHDLHVTLEGTGAEAVMDGLYLATGERHIDNYTLVEHAVAHTASTQLYKGILDDSARAVYNGHVRIHRDAQKANAAQTNNNLVLSRKAEIDTRPELEIDADDVKASHGATVGQIDPEHVFYLEARGIGREEAVRMLSRGFAQDVVFQIKNPSARDFMKSEVDRRFAGMRLGGDRV